MCSQRKRYKRIPYSSLREQVLASNYSPSQVVLLRNLMSEKLEKFVGLLKQFNLLITKAKIPYG
jgi:hypothetical protein